MIATIDRSKQLFVRAKEEIQQIDAVNGKLRIQIALLESQNRIFSSIEQKELSILEGRLKIATDTIGSLQEKMAEQRKSMQKREQDLNGLVAQIQNGKKEKDALDLKQYREAFWETDSRTGVSIANLSNTEQELQTFCSDVWRYKQGLQNRFAQMDTDKRTEHNPMLHGTNPDYHVWTYFKRHHSIEVHSGPDRAAAMTIELAARSTIKAILDMEKTQYPKEEPQIAAGLSKLKSLTFPPFR
jgi:uncharacterized coiled-coil protein SlyX